MQLQKEGRSVCAPGWIVEPSTLTRLWARHNLADGQSSSASTAPRVLGIVMTLPDLSHLDEKVSLSHLLNVFFRGAGAEDQPTQTLITSFIRLVDKTVLEYTLVGDRLSEYDASPRNTISPLIRATGHMENCLNALIRAVRFAERIRRGKTGPAVDRVVTPRLKNAYNELVGIRNSVEHMEEMLIHGELEEGAAVAIVLEDDQIELAGHTVRFEDLASWVEILHDLAVEWSDYRGP